MKKKLEKRTYQKYADLTSLERNRYADGLAKIAEIKSESKVSVAQPLSSLAPKKIEELAFTLLKNNISSISI